MYACVMLTTCTVIQLVDTISRDGPTFDLYYNIITLQEPRMSNHEKFLTYIIKSQISYPSMPKNMHVKQLYMSEPIKQEFAVLSFGLIQDCLNLSVCLHKGNSY